MSKLVCMAGLLLWAGVVAASGRDASIGQPVEPTQTMPTEMPANYIYLGKTGKVGMIEPFEVFVAAIISGTP
jgi:hypothetical protein